ncbi:nuclease-related domain-containing protein [Domibacillus tundrae]|uniref:nuclease-related domain-containing protein n=1 Tax=Domibacillus tundrae TaxID=1587527 RepID=UPI003397C90E
MRKSILHAKLETLNRRLIHPSKEVKEELTKCAAGLEGERRIFYYLSEITGPVRTLHDIRLPFPSGYTHFQMDTIVITRSLIIILEAKHIHGKLLFNRHSRQLIRGSDNFDDPITQVHRHKAGLEQWLDHPVPIMPAVVLTHPNVHVTLLPEDSPDRNYLLFAPEIPSKVDEFLRGKSPILTGKEVHQLADKLQQNHRPYDPNIMERFNVQLHHLQKGIQCMMCGNWSVKKQKKTWICHSCTATLNNPHLPALKDYVKLFGVKASNKQIRSFTGIESETTAKKLLQKWSVGHNGGTKGRIYTLPENWKWE